MRLKKIFPAFAAALSLHAQDVLPPVVVTADRSFEPEETSPYSVDVISSNQFFEESFRTLPEALAHTPGVLIQETTRGHGSPFIRGFTGRQNLLLLDGIRLNNSAFRGGPVQYMNLIDPYSLDRVEVVKSQGSVLYGSDAIGGTVHALTKTSGFRDEQGFFEHGDVIGRFETNGQSTAGRFENRLGEGGKWGLTLGASLKDYGDIRGPLVGLMENTGYQEQDFDAKLELALNKDTTLTFYGSYLNQDNVSRWHSTIFNPGWEPDGHIVSPGSYLARDYDEERYLSYVKLDGLIPEWNGTRYSATVSYLKLDESERQLRTPTDERLQTTEVQTLGASLSFETPVGPGLWRYGADIYHDQVDSSGRRDGVFRPDYRPVADDSNYLSAGLYTQYTWNVNEQFDLTFGGRYTHVQADLNKVWNDTLERDQGFERSWDNGVFNLRANYEFTDNWRAFGGVSQGFRAPNLDDLSGNLTARSGISTRGNAHLDPEKFVTYETGVEFHNDAAYVKVNGFYTHIHDAITGVPLNSSTSDTSTANSQNGYVYGVEVEGAWNITPEWLLSGYFSYQEGRMHTKDYLGGPSSTEPISRMMPLSGSLALRWTAPSEKYWAEIRAAAVTRADRLTQGDRSDTQRIPTGGTPGYIVGSVNLGWRPAEWLELTASLENVTNQDYRVHGSGQNQPGFNAIFGAKISW